MIELLFCNQKIFVWKANDVSDLRKNYRIVGSFIGSMPGFVQQNTDLGLPLQLMSEEAKVLIDNKIAVIVKYDLTVNEEMKQFYTKLKNDFYEQNCQQFRDDRKKTILQMSDKIIAGKMKKFSEEYKHLDRKELEKEIIRQELDKIPDIKPEKCATKVYTNCPFDNRISNVLDFDFPKTSKEMIRYEVFKDLWHKNYYITEGIKFGSDFLVYETDPIVVHSKFMVICREDNKQLNDFEVQMYGRLAKSVRKNILIAFAFNNYLQNDIRIEYKTIKWLTK